MSALPSPSAARAESRRFTQEQEAAIHSDADRLGVNAGAGTGKSTMLQGYAAARPQAGKMLYLAYNKSIKQEAEARFAGLNVKCMTGHGLAYRLGAPYADAGKLVGSIRVHEAIAALDLLDYPGPFRVAVADASLKLLNHYLGTAAPEITSEMAQAFLRPGVGVSDSDLAMCAQKLWTKMCDLDDPSVGMVHDGYLKLFQLSQPRLRGYSRILLDEAQDTSYSMVDVVEQQGLPTVFVGDTHQQLYSWRGASNAMETMKADQHLVLSQSFRFGQPIADVANLVLGTFKSNPLKLTGKGGHSAVGAVNRRSAYAVIARSNASLFSEAARLVQERRPLHFVGGIAGYRIGDVLDAFNLKTGQRDRVQHPVLKALASFDAADEYAQLTDDREVKSLLGIVKRYGGRTPGIVREIRALATDAPSAQAVSLTTAHKSKGLEFDQVILADDFLALFDDKGKPRRLKASEEEDVNILYVAVTRARRGLQPFPELQTLVDQHQAALKLQSRSERMPDWARPLPAPGRR